MSNAVNETAVHRAVLRGKPIELYGLTMWGLPMRQYEEWAKCKNVWLSRQSTFPVFCVSLPFLDAMFALDIDAVSRTGQPEGWLYNIMYALGMALRLDEDCVKEQKIHIVADEEAGVLNCLRVHLPNGEVVDITSGQFNKIRKVVAWANGDKLPDETLNDDLLETENFLNSKDAPPLDYNMIDLEASVALACGKQIRDVEEWSILEFETMRRAIDRNNRYWICGIGATNGCKWDGGNPTPSWCFDKSIEGKTSALVSMKRFKSPATASGE